MICLKNLARKYDLAIVTSIHQPNSDVLMMFDKLYVLSKGGKCVFDGKTSELQSHLQECQVDCQDWQVPVEKVIKVASKTSNVSLFIVVIKNNFYLSNRKLLITMIK